MEGIIFLALVSVIIMYVMYQVKFRYEPENPLGREHEKPKQMFNLFFLLGAAFIIKSIAAMFLEGHTTDINCFASWSDMVFDGGITNFYHSDAFTDYPPGYMYILFVTSAVRRLLGIDAASSMSGLYLIKLIPILCDLGAGFLIYKIARKKFSEGTSLYLSAFYMFNPAIVINSSIWCQVDSVFTLTVLLMCYFCMEQKRVAAYFVFALGILLKPQTLIFTPVLIFVIIDQVFLKGSIDWKKVGKEFGMGLLAIAAMFGLAAPYGLGAVIEQYKSTLGSYEYATINAYNFWAFLGRNWAAQDGKFLFLSYEVWGTIGIVAAVALGAFVYIKNRESQAKFYLSAAVIVTVMFTFSVRMHERYNYPVLALLLLAYILKPRKEFFYSFVWASAIHFLNVAHVLYSNIILDTTGPGEVELGGYSIDLILILSVATLILAGYIICHSLIKKDVECFTMIRTKAGWKKPEIKRKKREFTITPSKIMEKMSRTDYIVLFSILAIYSAIAFYKLGSTEVPETKYTVAKSGPEIVLDFGENKEIGDIWAFVGNNPNKRFYLGMGSEPGRPYDDLGLIKFDSVYRWEKAQLIAPEDENNDDASAQDLVISKPYRYVRFVSKDTDAVINELVILDKQGNRILPNNSADYPVLFDEQEYLDTERSYMHGTYFDEIYHARTAEEMIEGIYCYENTHPPLGKFLISIGIRAFGMNPFGWRFVGTLMGVLMLPFLYLFGKRMFQKTWPAAFVTVLFAFDFMHFTQTRIATIDVYGTFFIIAMYFFMYWYTQTSFYDTKLWKTLVPLGLCGISTGLGIASKWTAIYAAAGLALILFYMLYIRWREYKLALNNPNGSTAGIAHAHIVKNFGRYTIITLGACVVFFLIIPGTIYLLSYIPFSDDTGTGLWTQMIRNQKGMYSYHSALVATHSFSSWWYEWPTMIRPIYYHSANLANGMKEAISAFGNPLVWWAGIPSLGYMFYLIFKKRDKTALFIVVSYFIQYAPWMLVTRITFIYHYFPSVPFVVLMLGYTAVRIVDDKPKRIKYVAAYAVCAVALFVLFYPVLSGMATTENYIAGGLRWMSDWVLG